MGQGDAACRHSLSEAKRCHRLGLVDFCREVSAFERPLVLFGRGGGGDESSLRHPGGTGENLKSISHRCYLFEVAFVWELTKETIELPLGCLQGVSQIQRPEISEDTGARAPLPC